MVKKLLKSLPKRFGIEIKRYKPHPYKDKFVALKPDKTSRGSVLLSYRVEAFLIKDGDPLLQTHTNYWESYQIAQTFLDLGYCVDVIDFRNRTFTPRKDYAFFIGARTNFERIARLLNKDCIKIAHLDTAHWLFSNHASCSRSMDLQRRKGATITDESQRIIESNLAIEHADYATILGNQFTMSTYQYAQKPLFPVPISTCAMYPWPEDKDFESCRKKFLWFGSGGMVHKGLDLVLDVFTEMPDYHLYICGPIQKEKEFERLFRRELYETSNIHTIGWVDVRGTHFSEIMNECAGLIYPSSSEGQCGSVVNCMHGGLIPIISYESGLDVDDCGVILDDCSIDTIKNAVQTISGLPGEKLRCMSRKAWEFARANHTRERFAEEYRKVITDIVEMHRNKN